MNIPHMKMTSRVSRSKKNEPGVEKSTWTWYVTLWLKPRRPRSSPKADVLPLSGSWVFERNEAAFRELMRELDHFAA